MFVRYAQTTGAFQISQTEMFFSKILQDFISLSWYQIPSSRSKLKNSPRLIFYCTHVFLLERFKSSHRRCSIKKLFLKISQYSQKNTCVGVSLCQNCRPENNYFAEHQLILKGFSIRAFFDDEVFIHYTQM